MPSEFVKLVVEKSGMRKALVDDGSEEDRERFENVEELASVAARYDADPGKEGISRFLADAALASDQDELDQGEKMGVTLMTVHAAKGLEFGTIFVSGMEEGLFPHQGFDEKARDEEEERRLFYVAMTRAKERLFLTLARIRKIYGSDYITEPSSFLADINSSLMLYDETNGTRNYLMPKKSLGQNFLMHARIAERIANTANLSRESVVLEIGPGTGMLTRELLKKTKSAGGGSASGGKVIAIEADGELFDKLKIDFTNEISNGQLELIHGDIRTFDITSLPRGYELVANIPYYLTGEIFRMFLENPNQPSAMTLLVQKEVAERIARSKKPYSAKATKGKESILSLSVKVFGTPKYEFTIPRGAFRPAPKVDSAVLTVRDISRKNFSSNMPAFAEARRVKKNNNFLHLFAPDSRIKESSSVII